MKDVLKENEKIHMEEKLFSCTFCKKKFAPQDALKENEKIHSGEKLFTCSYCKKKFVLKDELKTQERIHSGERPFSCSHCKKKFVLKDKLKEHERSNLEKSHSPVLIARRNSSWRKTWGSMKGSNLEKSHSSDLVAEEIHPEGRPERAWEDHSGEKPFTCSDCKRKFVPKNDLREHENRRKASFHQHWSDGFSEYLEAQLLPSESGHSVSLFTRGKLSKFPMTSNHRQNCSIGQPISKKWFFAGSVWTLEKTQGKVGGDQEPPGDTWRHPTAPPKIF